MSALAAARNRIALSAQGRYVVHAHDDIAGVDPIAWDSLVAPGDFHATRRFIGVCRDSGIGDAIYRHITVHEGGLPVASASFCRMPVSLDLLSTGMARGAIRAARRLRDGFLRVPVAFCGLPISCGQSSVRFLPGIDTRAILGVVAAEMDRWARDTGAAVSCFKEFSPQERHVAESLAEHGYFRVPSVPSCTLDLRWRTFEDYIGAMRAGYRRQILASLRARDRLGLSVRLVHDWEAEAPRIFPLYEQVMDRAAFQLERLNLRFFQRLAADFGDRSSAVLVEREDRLLAAAILLHGPDALTFLLAGIDYAHNRQTQSYLTLVAEVVAEAIRRGAARLDLGQTTFDLKQRLGAVPDTRWLSIKCPNRAAHIALRAASRALFPGASPAPRRVFRDHGVRRPDPAA